MRQVLSGTMAIIWLAYTVGSAPALLEAQQSKPELEKRRGLVDVWVIKSVHAPTEK